jgi:hypothetical protein
MMMNLQAKIELNQSIFLYIRPTNYSTKVLKPITVERQEHGNKVRIIKVRFIQLIKRDGI